MSGGVRGRVRERASAFAVAVALDVPDRGAALELVDELGSAAELYKVGLELFTAGGPGVVGAVRDAGKEVFLDLKLHDIPATVAGAVRAACRSGAAFLTVHASGGEAMLRAAAEAAEAATAEATGAAGGSNPRLRLLGVTVLTSLGRADAERVWGREVDDMEEEVLRLARLCVECGLDGVVCSPREAARLRRELGPDPLLVTPGIRPAGTDTHDQARIATPADAVRAGADMLVVGRAVTAADDPAAALEAILREARGETTEPPDGRAVT